MVEERCFGAMDKESLNHFHFRLFRVHSGLSTYLRLSLSPPLLPSPTFSPPCLTPPHQYSQDIPASYAPSTQSRRSRLAYVEYAKVNNSGEHRCQDVLIRN